jgi:hypothetical protein
MTTILIGDYHRLSEYFSIPRPTHTFVFAESTATLSPRAFPMPLYHIVCLWSKGSQTLLIRAPDSDTYASFSGELFGLNFSFTCSQDYFALPPAKDGLWFHLPFIGQDRDRYFDGNLLAIQDSTLMALIPAGQAGLLALPALPMPSNGRPYVSDISHYFNKGAIAKNILVQALRLKAITHYDVSEIQGLALASWLLCWR